ncbi:MAG: hypothetical protein A3F72_17955 [Bacteroidetes bacterium RIFCSPLOWO2_12_FULL_35_15]|nr:MAG: hypothetical protein A3F72_17955 [Bacteroidetes bacterium RIFCSPLOWO2_12_FULL_35_15]
MKMKNLAIAAILLLTSAKINATDLCVAENGAGGCYSTITDAVNAAVNGDRIIINPKAGNAAYAENLTITKSLQFLCNVEGGEYTMQGNITITPAQSRIIVFIGMKNLQGNMTATGNSPVGVRCKVSIMNCNFVNGNVNLDWDNFDVTIASCVFLDGNIGIRYGKVIGNDINTISNYNSGYPNSYYRYSVYIGQDATATNDSLQIVGNKISYNGSVYAYQVAIMAYSANQYYYITNNILTGSSLSHGVYIAASKNSTIGRNTIVNNTISVTAALNIGVSITTVVNSSYDVINNLILATTGTGIAASGGGPVQVSYNLMSNPLVLSGITDDGTNNLSSNTTLDANNRPNNGSDAINGGSPDEAYYDINLTRNDAGAFGGSFTQDNFYPVTGAARVYFVRAPRKVTLGSTINVKGDAFDR